MIIALTVEIKTPDRSSETMKAPLSPKTVSATMKAISTSPVIDEIDAEVKKAVLRSTYSTVTKAQPTIRALGKSL